MKITKFTANQKFTKFYECSKQFRLSDNTVDRGIILAMAPPDIGRSVDPMYLDQEGRLCPPNNTGTPAATSNQ